MDHTISTAFFCLLMACLANASRKYYYFQRPSYRTLTSRIDDLEKQIISMKQQPVHVHINEAGKGMAKSEGTNVYVHLDVDGKSKEGTSQDTLYANCFMQPNSARMPGLPQINGTIQLRQEPGKSLEVYYKFDGFLVDDLYGLHVHQYADYTNGCNTFGGHYADQHQNHKVHGGPNDADRHIGDWGNVKAHHGSTGTQGFVDRVATLYGDHSIIGRGIVLHAGTDDLGKVNNRGSRATGNAGPRLACCTVGLRRPTAQ